MASEKVELSSTTFRDQGLIEDALPTSEMWEKYFLSKTCSPDPLPINHSERSPNVMIIWKEGYNDSNLQDVSLFTNHLHIILQMHSNP